MEIEKEIKKDVEEVEEIVEEEAKKHPFVFFWDPVIIYFIAMIVISNWPTTPTPEAVLGFYISDKIKHVILYFGFSFLLGMACRHSNFRILKQNHIFIALLAGSIIGILDEVNQIRVIGRHMGIDEMGLNIIGTILGQIVRATLRLERKLLRKIF